MEAIKFQSQIMVARDLDQRCSLGDDFYKSQLRQQIVDHLISEGLCEFDFSDPLFKRVTLTAVKPWKAVK